MIYAVVLASGKGKRIKDNIILPKQFREISGKPVVIHTLENLLKIKRFDKIYLVVPHEYVEYASKLIDNYIKEDQKIITTITGGKERMDSIENAINYIREHQTITNDDIVLIHDSVRPFVTERILNDSIDSAKVYGAVVAAMPVSDTLLISQDGKKVDMSPPRSLYYKGQSPDTFKLKLFIELLENLQPEERLQITGTSQICTSNNFPIYMVEGDEINFKITTKSDFEIANNVAKGGTLND